MKQYLMIIKGEGPAPSSPEEMQQALQGYMNWAAEMGDSYVDGQRLEPQGALLEGENVATDGPFLESKEIIAGYIVINAADQDEANALAKTCPLMEHCAIEVRPILALPQ